MHALATPRLRGLPLSEADVGDLGALHRDERVLAAFGADPLSAQETRAFLDRKLAHWREHGFGIWMFRDPYGAFGRCGIHRWALDGLDEVELGYIVRSEFCSQGFATEIGAAVVNHAFCAPASDAGRLHATRLRALAARAGEARLRLRADVCPTFARSASVGRNRSMSS